MADPCTRGASKRATSELLFPRTYNTIIKVLCITGHIIMVVAAYTQPLKLGTPLSAKVI